MDLARILGKQAQVTLGQHILPVQAIIRKNDSLNNLYFINNLQKLTHFQYNSSNLIITSQIFYFLFIIYYKYS